MANEELTDKALLLAYRIRELREKKYTTAKDAATEFGASPSQWTNWESATVAPFASTLQKIAAFFHVEVGYFSQKPENWDTEKRELLTRLRRYARKNKERYTLPDVPLAPSTPEPSQAPAKSDEGGEANVFLEIATLINNARKQVKEGTLAQATYEKNMKLLADLLELANS